MVAVSPFISPHLSTLSMPAQNSIHTCPVLEELHMDGCAQLVGLGLDGVPALRTLSMRACPALLSLEVRCRRLTRLQLGHLPMIRCRRVGGRGGSSGGTCPLPGGVEGVGVCCRRLIRLQPGYLPMIR